jgi:hypothetical protein
LLLYRTFDPICKHRQTNRIDFPYDPPKSGGGEHVKPPSSGPELEKFIDLLDRGSANPDPVVDMHEFSAVPSEPVLTGDGDFDAISDTVSDAPHKIKLITRREAALKRLF